MSESLYPDMTIPLAKREQRAPVRLRTYHEDEVNAAMKALIATLKASVPAAEFSRKIHALGEQHPCISKMHDD